MKKIVIILALTIGFLYANTCPTTDLDQAIEKYNKNNKPVDLTLVNFYLIRNLNCINNVKFDEIKKNIDFLIIEAKKERIEIREKNTESYSSQIGTGY